MPAREGLAVGLLHAPRHAPATEVRADQILEDVEDARILGDLQHPRAEQVRLGLHLLDVGHARLEALEPRAELPRALGAHRPHRRQAAVALERIDLRLGQHLGHGVTPPSRERSQTDLPAGISSPHASMAGRSGVNSRTRPATSLMMASMAARSAAESSRSAPASLASTSAGVRAPTSAVLTAGWPSTHASAIWLSGTPRGSAISRRSRSTTSRFAVKLSRRKIGWPNATPLPRQSREGSNAVTRVKAPVKQSMPEGAVAHHADAVGLAERKRLALLSAVEHVIADLQHVDAPRAHALGHHDLGEIRHPDEA